MDHFASSQRILLLREREKHCVQHTIVQKKLFMIALKALYREQERDTEAKRRRAEENPKPLTLDELREMEGEPVYNADNKTWYVVEDIDEIDELSTVISMTDTTEFDSEEGFRNFIGQSRRGAGNEQIRNDGFFHPNALKDTLIRTTIRASTGQMKSHSIMPLETPSVLTI